MPLKWFSRSLALQGFSITKARKELDSWKPSDAPNLKNKIVEHHLKNNPFYKNLVKDHSGKWEDLPIITKNILQQPLDSLLSNDEKKSKLFLGKTSGSSGHPFYFAKNKYAHAMTWACFFKEYAIHGIDLDTDLQARFYGIPLTGKSRYLELLKDFVSNRKRFPIFNLNDVVLSNFVNDFTKKPYNYINGYTSSIVLLAKYCQNNKINLKELCPTLKATIVTSEMLFPEDRLLLEIHLGIPVINEYGASEVGLIAIENKNGELVINTQTLFVEVVDDQNKPVPNGITGRILITDLYNTAIPMIRYEIGDLGSLKSFDNGGVYLDSLQGRTSDIAVLPSGKVIPGLTFYYVTKSVIKKDLSILEFVVIQRSSNYFEVQYVGNSSMSQLTEVSIRKAMDTYVEPGLKISFTKLAYLDRSKRGKLKQFMVEFN